MSKLTRALAGPSAIAITLAIAMMAASIARADDSDAKKLLKAMSDYMAAQTAMSFAYDATLDVVTKDGQKLALVSSGDVLVNRPDKIRTTRAGGFGDVELSFDGKTLTLFGKNANVYAQVEVPGTLEHLVDELREKYHRPLPAADLLLSTSYDELMRDVVDIKDLGSGVVGGVECDTFAFRKNDADFQIWIAQGNRPYPCRYTITSRLLPSAPQYTVEVRNWKGGNEVAAGNFTFKNATNAQKIDPKEVRDKFSDLPAHFAMGGEK